MSSAARRVRLLGGESTGKSTLSDLLARRFGTAWVLEWGRPYSDPKDHGGEPWTTADFVEIATRQNELEEVVARRAERILLCDTDAMTTGLHDQRGDRVARWRRAGAMPKSR